MTRSSSVHEMWGASSYPSIRTSARCSRRESTQPSVILLRRHVPRRAADQLTMLLQALPSLSDALLRSAIVVLERGRARVRTLPIAGAGPAR
jgi:hypothetical protein